MKTIQSKWRLSFSTQPLVQEKVLGVHRLCKSLFPTVWKFRKLFFSINYNYRNYCSSNMSHLQIWCPNLKGWIRCELNADPGPLEQLDYEAVYGGSEILMKWKDSNTQNIGLIIRFIYFLHSFVIIHLVLSLFIPK